VIDRDTDGNFGHELPGKTQYNFRKGAGVSEFSEYRPSLHFTAATVATRGE